MPGPAYKGKRIFELLVTQNDDFFGILAYSFYKRQKYEIIRASNEKGESEDELNAKLTQFYELSVLPGQIANYKQQAEVLAAKFAEDVLENELDDKNKSLAEQAKQISDLKEALDKAHEQQQKGFAARNKAQEAEFAKRKEGLEREFSSAAKRIEPRWYITDVLIGVIATYVPIIFAGMVLYGMHHNPFDDLAHLLLDSTAVESSVTPSH